MVMHANNDETTELASVINQGTLNRHSIKKYIFPFLFISPFSDEEPQTIESNSETMSGQTTEVFSSIINRLKPDYLADPGDPLIYDIHEVSQSSSYINSGDSKVYLEQYLTMENFAKELLENSTTLPGEINKLMYDNIDDLLI